jgi:hypothetical protein
MKRFGKLIGIISAIAVFACLMTACDLLGIGSTSVKSVALNRTETTLLEGKSETLFAYISPPDADNQDVHGAAAKLPWQRCHPAAWLQALPKDLL